MSNSPDSNMRIFMSHSSKDESFCSKLAADLRRVLGNENAVWYDASGGLHGGDDWWPKIVNELTTRNVFILVVSPDAMASDWVNDEINLAWRQKNSPLKMRIIPVLYSHCEIRKDILGLQMTNFLPPKTYTTAFNELLIALGLTPEPEISSNEGTGNAPAARPNIIGKMLTEIEISFVEQDWPTVIRKINLLNKRDPDALTADMYRMQGIALREEGDLEPAQYAFDTALALVSDRMLRLTILDDLADLYMRQEKWREALRLTNEALRLSPNSASWKTRKKEIDNKLNPPAPVSVPKYDPPLYSPPKPNLSKASQKSKTEWVNEGFNLSNQLRYYDAIAAYNNAIELDPYYALAYHKRCVCLGCLGQNDKAIVDSTRSIELDPKYAPAYYSRGDAYRLLGDYQKALVDCNRALELDPKYKLAYWSRGATYRMLGEYQKAIADCNRAIEIDPQYAQAYATRGDIYRLQGDYQKAIADSTRALELDPKNVPALYTRADAYRLVNDYQKAIADSSRAIELDADYKLAYWTRGATYRMLGDYQKAINDCNRVLELDPQYAQAYATRGDTYRLMKQYTKALKDLDRAIELDPTYTWATTQRAETVRAMEGKA